MLTKVDVHCFLLVTYSIIESNPALTSLTAYAAVKFSGVKSPALIVFSKILYAIEFTTLCADSCISVFSAPPPCPAPLPNSGVFLNADNP